MKPLTLLLGFLLVFPLFSQTDSSHIFGLPQLRIYQKEKGNEVVYTFDNSLNKFTLTSNFLISDTNRYKYRANINDINKVSFRNGSHVWGAAGVTGAAGFVLGFLFWGFFQLDGPPKFTFSHAVLGGAVISVPFALVGGLIGLIIPKYDYYSIINTKNTQKYELLKRLFKKYQLKR
jgi:hypothetical protein